MSYDGSKSYKEYALINGINLLVNMVEQTKDDKTTLKEIHTKWIESGVLSFADQIELIWGTAADGLRCRYMAFCINQLNSYMMSKHPNHIGLIRCLTRDILNAINMAIMGNAHIWSMVQIESIKAAFRSGQVSKPTPYRDLSDKKTIKKLKKIKEKEKQKYLEYNEH
ncbi:hypothetical protein ES703_75258 [subsurface metagenome]